jgi:HEAT repeat protein
MVDFILASNWSYKVRSVVYNLVKKIADKKAVDALIPILRENEDAARFYEPLTSWIIGSPQSVEVLAYASNDKDYFVRYMAAKALVNIGSAPAINALINALENGDDSMREIAANVLGDSKDKCVISVLVNAEQDSNKTVRNAAEKSLRKMKYNRLD